MTTVLIDVFYGLAAFLAFLGAVLAIRATLRRPPWRRLTLALSLLAFTGGVELLRVLVPTTAAPLKPYLWVLFAFALTYLVLKVVEVLLLDVVARRRGRPLPPAILRDLVSGAFAAVVLVVLLRTGLGVDVTTLVATSAALSIILGLALQETLANLFAGLALITERPFEPGDWIQVGGRTGQVREVSWRAVKLQLLQQDDYLVVPNSVIAKSEIVNLSRPPRHGVTVEVAAPYAESPGRVRQVLVEAAREVPGVLPWPEPFAAVLRFDAYAVVYRLTYWVEQFARLPEIEGEVLARVWYAFRRHGITVPYPTTHVYSYPGPDQRAEERRLALGRVIALLRQVDFLEALSRDALEQLAGQAQVAPYAAGAVVVRKGEAGDSLFVIAAGRVQVLAQGRNGEPERAVAELGPGEYFGEMSLLTGAPRAATVRAVEECELVVLTSQALRPVLAADPAAAERLSRTLARRRGELSPVDAGDPTAAVGEPEEVAGPLLPRIRRFFGLGGEA